MRHLVTWLVRNSMKVQCFRTFTPLRHFEHIPPQPITLVKQSPDKDEIVLDEDIMLLERLSLVDFGNRQGVERLTEAIKFANSIKDVDTDGVEPLYTVQEDRSLELRPDALQETPSVDEVVSCATITEDEYFVAPPGNVPLEITNTYRQDSHRQDIISGDKTMASHSKGEQAL